MAVAMTGAVMNRARCVVPSHTIYPVARPCAVRTHHSQSHKAARLPSRLLRPAFNTAAAERAVLGLWPSIRPVTCIDSELGSTLTVRRAHRELLAAACIDINVVRKVIVTPHCACVVSPGFGVAIVTEDSSAEKAQHSAQMSARMFIQTRVKYVFGETRCGTPGHRDTETLGHRDTGPDSTQATEGTRA